MTRHILLTLAVWLFACAGAWAGELTITAPAEGALVAQGIVFTAAVKELPALAAVEWQLNGRAISGSLLTPPTFAWKWHPAEVLNGPMTIQAIGRDSSGKVVAVSTPVHFSAHLGPGDMALSATSDLSQPLSGTVTFTIHAIRPLTDAERAERVNNPKFDQSQLNKTVEAIQVFIDGQCMTRQFGAPTCPLGVDTTRLLNGAHEFTTCAYAWLQGVPPIGMLQTTFTTENGHTPMALLPHWQTLALQPGETAELAPRVAFTDGKTEPLKPAVLPTYTSATPAVATVNAQGQVQAVGRGVAVITVSLPARTLRPDVDEKTPPYTAEVRVLVGLPAGLPHFSRDGHILLQYDPKQSVFVRSMFCMSPQFVLDTPGLAALVKDAGVNTCESGFFNNPNDGSHVDSLEKYIAGWDPWFDGSFTAPAKKLGVGMILSGDDWVRTGNELKWTASTPWAPDLARHIWTKLRDSGVVTSVEMMDEASFLGAGPAPTDGHWAKWDPAIHDDTLVKLIAAIRSVDNYTPISWPVLGLAGPETAHNWMGDPRYADYASQYWTVMDWRAAYPWSTSGPQMKNDLDRVMVGRFPVMQWDKPQLLLVSGCGPYYTKRVEGDHFQPGLDEGTPNNPPLTLISDEALYAVISGAAGVRMYSTDFMWKPQRAQAPLGSAGLQTGASPFGAGSDRWHALSAAYNLINKGEPYLLQPQANAIALGPDFSVGARRGPNSRLLMAINWAQAPRTVSIDLTPYHLAGAKWLERYHVLGATSWVEVLPNAWKDTITFAPGEFVAWLERTADTKQDIIPPAVRLFLPEAATITGPITLRADAHSHQGIKQVEFFLNGKSLGSAVKAPYAVPWDAVTTLKNEWHGVKAVATDTAGNQSEARSIIRVLDPTP